jgi:hypothetical protein
MTSAAVWQISSNDPNDTPISCSCSSSSALSPCKSVLLGESDRCPAYSDCHSGIVGDGDGDNRKGDRDRDGDREGESGAESDGSTDRDADGDTDREFESEESTTNTDNHNDGGNDKDDGPKTDQSPVEGGGQGRDGGGSRQRDSDTGRSVCTVPIKMGRVSVRSTQRQGYARFYCRFTLRQLVYDMVKQSTQMVRRVTWFYVARALKYAASYV